MDTHPAFNSYYEKLADGTVRCIDSEIPFDIPDNWAWCRVCNIFILNPKNNNEDEDMAAFIPMEMIDACYGSSFLYKEVKWKSIKNGYTHFSDGDIAFAKITPCFQNRKSAVFENLPNGIGAGTTELKVLRPYANTVNPYYLLFFLETPCFVEEASFKGTANQQRIISGYLESKLFPLPSKAEQDRIVKQIQQLLPLTNKYEFAFEAHLRQQNSINSLLKKSILQEAIQGRLVPQIESEGTAEELLAEITEEKKRLVKEGKLKKSALTANHIIRGDDNRYYEQIGSDIEEIEVNFNFPNNWSVCRLKELCQLTDGEKTEGSYPCLDAKYLRGKSSATILNGGKMVYKNDNIILVDGENSGEVFTVPCDGYMGSTFKQLWISRQVDKDFVLLIILFYKSMLRNSKKGAAIPHLNKELFYNIIVGVPPILEQKRITNRVSELFDLIK